MSPFFYYLKKKESEAKMILKGNITENSIKIPEPWKIKPYLWEVLDTELSISTVHDTSIEGQKVKGGIDYTGGQVFVVLLHPYHIYEGLGMQLAVALGFNKIKVSPCEALQSSPKVNLTIDYGQWATSPVRMGERGETQSIRRRWNERGKNENK